MNLLSAENLAKSYGERVLFEQVSLHINEGDKIGLIGVNGAGKSTFLSVLTGREPADAGNVTLGSGVRVEYLPQNPEFDNKATVLEQIFQGKSPAMQTIREYESILQQIQLLPDDAGLQKKLIQLTQQMETTGAWKLESDAKTILTRLGIVDFTAVVSQLSGGQRKRIALAAALIHPADLLILDEPTNHIDNEMVAWLEQYLQSYTGALLMITHDRYFLDRVSNRILEIDKGRMYAYAGNYEEFLVCKAEREAQQESSELKRQNILRNELAWIRRGAQARSTKQKARIDRFEQLSAQKNSLSVGKLEMEAGSSRLGRKIIELNEVSHGYGGANLICDFTYFVLRNDRIGIIGPNGSGKSTLLNLVSGRLLPQKGTIEIGQTVKIGYFSQESAEMDETLRVIEYIREEANFITTLEGETISASQMLERFLFPPNAQWMPIAKLSGGERRRLFLLRILMGAPNVLLLDEPTNDLDVQTLTILEDYLDDFPGAVIVVSHDRYFLDRVVDKIFAFTEGGVLTQYAGGYTDYQEKCMMSDAAVLIKNKKNVGKKLLAPDVSRTPRKFTFKEQREYEEIESVIAGVERELQLVSSQVNAAGSDFVLLQQLTVTQNALEKKLDELMGRWTYLNELDEEIHKGREMSDPG
ncbi:MAG: ABC-F family ATP-binding cassette domain-containing protein [Negativicutes bacterium]